MKRELAICATSLKNTLTQARINPIPIEKTICNIKAKGRRKRNKNESIFLSKTNARINKPNPISWRTKLERTVETTKSSEGNFNFLTKLEFSIITPVHLKEASLKAIQGRNPQIRNSTNPFCLP